MTGDCYEAALHYMLDNAGNNSLRLVHGEVAGQGPLQGCTYGHAWIEEGDLVIDVSNGRDIRLPKELYYAIGRINELNNTHVYTLKEMAQRAKEYEVYGPWELEGKHPDYVQGPAWEDDDWVDD